MRILVCGSRHFNDKELLESELRKWDIHTIIEGEARGADTLAREYGVSNGLAVLRFPADWATHGRAAGPIRNAQMLREGNPDLVIAFRGPNSRGTQNMINQAEKAGIQTVVVDVF